MKEYPVKTKKLKFYHKNLIYRFLSNCVYYIIGVPFAWLFVKIVYGAKIVGKKKWKRARLRKTGVFVYANHTTAADALFVPLLLALPKRTRIICSIEFPIRS